MTSHPFLDRLDSVLRDLVPSGAITFSGTWTRGLRSGPHGDIADARWCGSLTSVEPVGAIGFLLAGPGDLHWAKSREISPVLSVDVSLSAYTANPALGATFMPRVGGADLPGVPVAVTGALEDVCTMGAAGLTAGHVTCLARTVSAAFFVVLIQGQLLKVGRKRLWHLCDDRARLLPGAQRELLLHRRTGVIKYAGD